MATSEERIKILQMIQDGKISAADGSKLLEALNRGASGRGPQAVAAGTEGRYVRIRVTDTNSGRNKVNVNLPLSLVDAGLGIASNFVPGVDNMDIQNAIRTGLVGKVMDVTGDEGEHVEVFIE